MHVVRSTVLPLAFHPDNRIRNVSLCIVRDILYGCVLGAVFFRANRSLLSIAEGEDLKPMQDAQ